MSVKRDVRSCFRLGHRVLSRLEELDSVELSDREVQVRDDLRVAVGILRGVNEAVALGKCPGLGELNVRTGLLSRFEEEDDD